MTADDRSAPGAASVRDVWHVVHGDDLRALLGRAHKGEDPDLLYVEFYANADERARYWDDGRQPKGWPK